MKYKDTKWVLIRDGEVCNVFNDRKDAVKHLKELLRQTLKDFDNQDKTDEYDYPILIPKIEMMPVKERSSSLSLV